MNIKEKLIKLKSALLEVLNRDYEFNTDFEVHQIGDSNIYRLYYVDYTE